MAVRKSIMQIDIFPASMLSKHETINAIGTLLYLQQLYLHLESEFDWYCSEGESILLRSVDSEVNLLFRVRNRYLKTKLFPALSCEKCSDPAAPTSQKRSPSSLSCLDGSRHQVHAQFFIKKDEEAALFQLS